MHGNFFFQLRRKRSFNHPAADLGTGLEQRIDIIYIQRSQTGVNTIGQAVVRQKSTIGFCTGRKPTRDTYAGIRQLADHFAQRGILTADLLHIGHAKFFKVDHKSVHERSLKVEVKNKN